MNRNIFFIAAILIFSCTLFTGCFTGVESTKVISDKDVRRIVDSESQEEKEANSLAIPVDSFANWRMGKSFYVCDDNASLIFAPSTAYDADTLHLKGTVLRYVARELGSVLDNRETVNVVFTDGRNRYTYPTGRTIDEIKRGYTIPFLIDMDEVSYVNNKLRGSRCYIKTSIWYDENGHMTSGRKYVEVRIDSVMPGNKVFPIKVLFTDVASSRSAMVWMTTGGTVMKNRSFDALFSFTDIRRRYPLIEDDVWQCIVEGKVKAGMTKDEVRLSLGNPTTVSQRPTHEGIKEVWIYSDGKYLYFDDGLLMER